MKIQILKTWITAVPAALIITLFGLSFIFADEAVSSSLSHRALRLLVATGPLATSVLTSLR